MENKRIIIVGAGMAGLCAGCYLAMNGYDTEIFELHDNPGGLCTSWYRKGFTFDGCIHWLVGSSPSHALYRLWSELIDMYSITFVDHDRLMDLEMKSSRAPDGDRIFHFYSDLDRFERYLQRVAPQDKAHIRALMSAARRIRGIDMGASMMKPKELNTWRDKLAFLANIPAFLPLMPWDRMSLTAFARKVKSPFLAEALVTAFEGMDASVLLLLFQLAWFDQRSAGYPLGGSMAFAKRFADRFSELGGQIHYRSRVARILVEGDRAVGVQLADGSEHRADVVISAADGHFTLFEALGGRYLTPRLKRIYDGQELKRFPSLMIVSLGIDRLLEQPTTVTSYVLDEPWTAPDGTRFERMTVHPYGYDPTMAPPGKTMLNVILPTSTLGFWKRLRETDREAYRLAKDQVADRVTAFLDARLGDIRSHVEVVDVATPATFHRYTNNWEGSFEGWMPPLNLLKDNSLPHQLPGLKDFYMIGQWTEPGGGLPPAVIHGRQVTQLICHRDRKPFVVMLPGEEDGPGRERV
ncbi:MAG: NAD(P)/FAD-dependent oxidoreductase [Bradymonadales bacterium]|nr:NAD(P)/FAD-dependent oxidoreductase [Bradymonadales bacterium]